MQKLSEYSDTPNSVVLIDYMGGDKLNAAGAWCSTYLESGTEMPEDVRQRTDALIDPVIENKSRMRGIKELIYFLAAERHMSPFRGSKLIFLSEEDLITHVHMLKHKVAVEHENGESARYKVIKNNKYYLPKDWLDYGETGLELYRLLEESSQRQDTFYHMAVKRLVEAGMPKQRAKETARYFRLQNSQLTVMRSVNFDGLVQLYEKRSFRTKAQREVAALIEGMVQCVRDIPGNPFEHSLAAFGMG